MTRTLALIAIAALSFSGVAANAATDSDQPSISVSYADLNLATPAGAATLKTRIETASVRACAMVGDDQSLGGLHDNKACRDELIKRATKALEPAMVADGPVGTSKVATR